MSRPAYLLPVLAAVVFAAGCGGSKPQPLGLRQRVVKEGELTGFTCYPNAPKGVPKPPCALIGLTVVKNMGNAFINDPRAAQKRLGDFRSNLVNEAGEDLQGVNGVGNATSLTLQFGSSKEAKTFLGKLFPESFAPCPEKCQVVKTEFKVSGIKGAKGAKLSLTAGPAAARFQAYRVEFADGPFVYGVAAYAPLGKLKEETVVSAAKTLYERVKGRPAPQT